MRTLKISLIASLIATVVSFWASGLGVTHRMWPAHPQLAGFLITLVTAIAVQLAWPLMGLSEHRDKS